MADITVKFADGKEHVYTNVPDTVTPDQIEQRANQEFQGSKVSHIARQTAQTSGQPSPLVGDTPQQSHEGMTHYTSSSQGGLVSPLQESMRGLSSPERFMVGAGSALAKTGLGVKQLVTGNQSPEDQQAVKDWTTIEQEAPAGAIAGNVGMMVAPGIGAAGTLAKFPRLTAMTANAAKPLGMAGRAVLSPLGKTTVGSAAYMGLQPTEQQGMEGLQQRGYEAGKGALLGMAGYGAMRGLGKVVSPEGQVLTLPTNGAMKDAPRAYIAPNADEVARTELLKRLPVPITENDIIRSQITRKYPQQEAERMIAGQPFIGEELTARLARGQEKMGANIEALQSKTGAKAPSAEQAGETVRTWMQNIYGAAKTDTNKAYEYAKQLHGDKLYKPQDQIIDALVENRAMPGYRELFAQAKNMGMIVPKQGGGFTGGRITVNELDKFKSIANQVAQSADGTTRYAGGDIVNKVYSQLDDVAPEFRDAARLRKNQGMTFEDPKVTKKILGTVEGRFGAPEQQLGGVTIPNYQIASEKLIDSVAKGSIEDLRYIRKLAASGTFAQKREGVQAIREMRGNVLDGMKGVWDSTITPQAKANQINKYFDKLGDEKIELIFSKAGAQKIADFRKAAEIMNKGVPSPEGGSQTAGRLMMMGRGLLTVLEKTPILGPIVGAPLVQGGKIINDIGIAKAAKKIPQAQNNLATLAFRQKVGNTLSDMAPLAGVAATGYGQ